MNFEPGIRKVSATIFIDRHPDILNTDEPWKMFEVGPRFEYPQCVHDLQLYKDYGVFMELFMRKCLCKKHQQPLMDKNPIEVQGHIPILEKAYLNCADGNNDALDIVNDIKIVALLHRSDFGEAMEVDYDNLRAIQQYIETLPFDRMSSKQSLDMECGQVHINGVADFIFDDSVILQVSTSMFEKPYPYKCSKVLFYALAHYYKYYYPLEKQYTLMLYNPLLGIRHEKIININADLFNRIRSQINSIYSN
ncbi:uncharacterized protein LOC142234989 isoform X2 [Haematobia irritans]|uniref:uncharacterized protein LOC142234989 isoform X2 n=1 Tax=Haematobia irritans TaxID=7368 RepID=UPI003F502DD8